MLSDSLNGAGLDLKTVLKPEISINWTPHNIKEYLWRPIQEAMLGKESTTTLNTSDITKIYDVLNRHLGERFGVHVGFPSEDQIDYYLKTRKCQE